MTWFSSTTLRDSLSKKSERQLVIWLCIFDTSSLALFLLLLLFCFRANLRSFLTGFFHA